MEELTEIGIALVASAIFWLAFEYVMHRWVMHRRPRNKSTRPTSLWQWYEEHMVLHHGKYFTPAHPAECSDLAAMHVDNVTNPLTTFAVSTLFWPSLAYFGLPYAAATVGVFGFVYGYLWTAVHHEIHRPTEAWWTRNFLFRAWRAHHVRHHERPGTNYGTLFVWPIALADLVMRTRK